MKISLVIPTYNGVSKVKNLLWYLERQTVWPLEIIFVVDGSTDDTMNFFSNYLSKNSQLPLKILWQENAGRGSARAAGANQARGEILLFTDDDTTPPVTWIEYHHKNFNPNQVSFGPVLPTHCEHQCREFFGYFSSLIHKWNPLENCCDDIEVKEFSGQNVCISSKLYFDLGGFNPRLRDAEDRDFSRRIASSQISIYLRSKCLTYASGYKNFYEYSVRRRQYDEGNSRITMFNRRRRTVRYIKNLIFTPSVNSILLDRIPILRTLPLNLRYKLYDWILF